MIKPQVESAVQRARYLISQAFADEVRPLAEKYYDDLRQLRKAATNGDVKGVKNYQRIILRSYAAHFVCLVRSVDKSEPITAEWIRATAHQLNLYQDPGEPIIAWAEPKGSGKGWRPLCSFGPKRMALQTLCADILVEKFGVDPINYNAKGKGPEIASDHIVYLVEEEDYDHFVLADIKDFFRSVQQECLQGVTGLPKRVIQTCIVITPHVSITLLGSLPYGVSLEMFDGAVREGLPQGSRASQMIASMLLGPALREVTSADRIVVHGDDIAISARSLREAQALDKALVGILESHPAGPFRVKHQVAHVNDGFDYLKYRHRRDWFTGKVHRRPAAKSYWRYTQNVMKIMAANPLTPAIKKIARYRWNWMKSFLRWRWNQASKLMLWFTTTEAMDQGSKKKKAAEKVKSLQEQL